MKNIRLKSKIGFVTLLLSIAFLCFSFSSPIQASASTSISGTITNGVTPLSNIKVSVSKWNDSWWGWEIPSETLTDVNGDYLINNLTAGNYRVFFNDSSKNYVDEYYNDKSMFDNPSLVLVTDGITTENINASLALAGKISGRVTNSSGDPLKGIIVQPSRFANGGTQSSGSWSTSTDENGNYFISGLPMGNYKVNFLDLKGNFVRQWYDLKLAFNEANLVSVAAGFTAENINASLSIAGKIGGRITNSSGDPIKGISINAYEFNGSWWEFASGGSTDVNGNYIVGGLVTGQYKLKFQNSFYGDYLTEYYNDKQDIDEADQVSVSAGSTTGNIDAILAKAGKITGQVTNSSGDPLKRVVVSPYKWNGNQWNLLPSRSTEINGNYAIGNLSTGNYKIRFRDSDGSYLTEYYNNKQSLDSADPVLVTEGIITENINAQLTDAGRINGKVTNSSGDPLNNVQVTVYKRNGSQWEFSGGSLSDIDGNYLVGGLITGEYKIRFAKDYDFFSEYYNDKPILGQANSILVSAGQVATLEDVVLNANPNPYPIPDPPAPPIYDNSSGNYDNSSGLYDNSSGAYNNSSGSYDNSSGYYTPDPGGQNPGGGNSGGGNNPSGNTGVTSPIGANPGGGNPLLIIQATNLSLKATPKSIQNGKAATIKGHLKDASGKPLAGKKVQIKANGKVIKTVTTDANGRFSFKHKPKKTTSYQAAFAGDSSYQATSSKEVKVKVKKAKKKAKAKKKKKKNK